jgi:hypothetical protein
MTTQQVLAKFWTPVDWQPYSPDLSLLDFSIWNILQASPGNVLYLSGHPLSIHRYGMGLASGRRHPQDLLLIPLPPGGCHGKNGANIKLIGC